MLIVLILILFCGPLFADDSITANPNRPTVSNPADITQYGVLELEYGTQFTCDEGEIDGLFKFSAARDFEVRIDNVPFVHAGGVSGFGDVGVGFQYRFLHQSDRAPSMAFAYSLKLPTATNDLGTDRFDHDIIYLISKDLGEYHADFNLDVQISGREDEDGYDTVAAPAFAVSRSFGNVTIAGEISGTSRQNDEADSTVSTLWAVSYGVSPRFVVDAAVSFRLHGDLPDATFLTGLTYSIADLYHRR